MNSLRSLLAPATRMDWKNASFWNFQDSCIFGDSLGDLDAEDIVDVAMTQLQGAYGGTTSY